VNWSTDAAHGTSISIDDFYLAHEGDSAATINAQLASGKHLLLTPGVYHLESAIRVTHADTVVLGIGMASLTPTAGTAAIEVADVAGVKIAGITVDAGVTNSAVLVQVGPAGAAASDPGDPTTLSDVFIRVGGPWAGNATTSIEINSDHVLLDHIWAWRGDHGLDGTGTWTSSRGDHGLVVNGDSVTATGLFVEHYQKNQVVWNGDDGVTVFYQSEIPYEVPSQAAWMDGSRAGFASYRVADDVTRHAAYGLGIYSFFNQGADIWAESGVQAPRTANVTFDSITTVMLNGSGGIRHQVNDAGDSTTTPGVNHQLVSYPPAGTTAATVAVNPATVKAGGTFTITGADIPAGTYTLVLHSDPVTLATVTVGADGVLSTTATVPASTSPGAHSLRLTADAGVVLAAADVTVIGGAALAATGASADGLVLALLLLVLGGVGMWWRRRALSATR